MCDAYIHAANVLAEAIILDLCEQAVQTPLGHKAGKIMQMVAEAAYLRSCLMGRTKGEAHPSPEKAAGLLVEMSDQIVW